MKGSIREVLLLIVSLQYCTILHFILRLLSIFLWHVLYFAKKFLTNLRLSSDRPYRPSLTDVTHRPSLGGGVTVMTLNSLEG